MIDYELINRLVTKASRLGAQGYEVKCWIPPASASCDPDGTLVLEYKKNESISASGKLWYE